MGFNFSALFPSFNSGGTAHGGGAQPTQLPNANPQQQIQTGQAAGTTGGNPVSGVPATQPEPKPEDSLLANMASLWQSPTTADGKPVAPQADPLTQQIHSFDPAKIAEAASKLDFTRSLTDEVLQKAGSGDTAALRSALNHVVQQAFTGMTVNSATLVNQGFEKYGKLVDAALPDRIKQYQVHSTESTNPIYSTPAIKPLMTALKAVATQNKPGASAAEIQSTAEEFLQGFATLMAGQQQQTQQQQVAEKEVDWLSFAGMSPSK